jgi:hypothetical protein
MRFDAESAWKVIPGALLGGSGNHGYNGVRTAVIKEPLVVEVHQAFGEGRSGRVLSGFLVGHHWLQDGVLGLLDQAGGIGLVEERFPGGIGIGT